MPRSALGDPVEAAFMAGSALNRLDDLVRSDAPWLGAWRHRLALKAAAGMVQLAGRREGEGELRDAWYLRRPGDEPGPAGDAVLAWRRLAGRSHVPDGASLGAIARLAGLGTLADADRLAESIAALIHADGPAPLIAARAADTVIAHTRNGEPLAWWLADLVLSMRMRWKVAVPLLATQVHSPLLRQGRAKSRLRPGEEGFGHACLIAAAAGAAEACQLAAAMAVRAQRLAQAAPKLRAKGAGEAVALLLDDDAVPGTLTTRHMSRWASRRLFERLEPLGAVRELTGRSAFRLYGL